MKFEATPHSIRQLIIFSKCNDDTRSSVQNPLDFASLFNMLYNTTTATVAQTSYSRRTAAQHRINHIFSKCNDDTRSSVQNPLDFASLFNTLYNTTTATVAQTSYSRRTAAQQRSNHIFSKCNDDTRSSVQNPLDFASLFNTLYNTTTATVAQTSYSRRTAAQHRINHIFSKCNDDTRSSVQNPLDFASLFNTLYNTTTATVAQTSYSRRTAAQHRINHIFSKCNDDTRSSVQNPLDFASLFNTLYNTTTATVAQTSYSRRTAAQHRINHIFSKCNDDTRSSVQNPLVCPLILWSSISWYQNLSSKWPGTGIFGANWPMSS
eukprot:sb/3466851/